MLQGFCVVSQAVPVTLSEGDLHILCFTHIIILIYYICYNVIKI